jgi:hypothetical protein
MPNAQNVYDWLLRDEVINRLREIVKAHQGGATEHVGRLVMDDEKTTFAGRSDPVRLGGGFKSALFPELEEFDQGPADLVRSIQSKRRSQLQRNIHAAVFDFIEENQGEEIKGWMSAHPQEAVNAYLKAA